MIEVVRISDPLKQLSSADLMGDDVPLREADQVRDVLSLIRSVPGSELHRCFSPGWGIRAHGVHDLLFQIAFCFQCHGARLWGPRVPAEIEGIQGFDSESSPAQGLLQEFAAVSMENGP